MTTTASFITSTRQQQQLRESLILRLRPSVAATTDWNQVGKDRQWK
jgi:hypothetical protein